MINIKNLFQNHFLMNTLQIFFTQLKEKMIHNGSFCAPSCPHTQKQPISHPVDFYHFS